MERGASLFPDHHFIFALVREVSVEGFLRDEGSVLRSGDGPVLLAEKVVYSALEGAVPMGVVTVETREVVGDLYHPVRLSQPPLYFVSEVAL